MVLLWRACSAPTSSFYCQWCLSKTGSRSLIWGVWSCSSGPDTNVAACKKQSFKAGTVPSYLSLSLLFAVDLSVHLFYKHKNMFVGFTYACTHRCITHTHTFWRVICFTRSLTGMNPMEQHISVWGAAHFRPASGYFRLFWRCVELIFSSLTWKWTATVMCLNSWAQKSRD